MKAAGVEVPDHEAPRVRAAIIAKAVEHQRTEDSIADWKAAHRGYPSAVLRRAQGTLRRFDDAASALLALLQGDLADMTEPATSERPALALQVNSVLQEVRREARGWQATKGKRGEGGTAAPWRENAHRALVALNVPSREARRLLTPAALRRAAS